MIIVGVVIVILAIVLILISAKQDIKNGDTGRGIFLLISAVIVSAIVIYAIKSALPLETQGSDWQIAADSFLLQEVEEDTYVVEQNNGTYLCKVITNSSIGETEATCKVIEENDDTTVSFYELMEGEKPYGEVLERTSTDDETQTMYVFHVPATEN